MVDLNVGDAATLDALGLLCPLPVIRTQDKVKGLTPGTELEVLATDPGAMHDIQAWCRVHGHEYLRTAECGRGGCAASPRAHFHIWMRVAD